MKLLINTDITFKGDFTAGGSEEEHACEREDLEEVLNLLRKCCVHFFEDILEGCFWSVTIMAQKCTLDEYVMNDLFNNGFFVLSNYKNISLRYAPLGGRGCDFAMELVNSDLTK